MELLILATLTGLSLLLLEVLRSVPANLQVFKSKSADGLSDTSLGILLGTAPGWIALGVIADAPWVAIASGFWSLCHLLLCFQVSALRGETSRIWNTALSSFVLLAALVGTGAAFGQAALVLGLVISFSALAFDLPALLAGMRSKTTRGLSVISLSVNTLEGGIYLVSGLGFGLLSPSGHFVLGFAAFGFLAILCNLPRLVRTSYRRLKHLDHPQSSTSQEIPVL